ncbi:MULTISPECIES: hypothetical protein [Prauserella salsuginis group]|uniref:HK97 gp10 family phage protein n=2 Tax=Prauserella salsuginis group TaxID=2893672 RepID=A0A839XT68_9PSEU|nr:MULTISPECIES: hypothetical protein [Prauserella salsuginis group]MBB3666400.1 hypothetical protein [Prauserella sediminis]MCR3719138.1 hypothetical protein [Prauserella flava]MCR3735849.1 hypothetical protein [Prauserella salsuginis]
MNNDVRRLAADLDKKAARALPAVAAVVAKGANNIKKQMRDEATSQGSYQHFHRTIGYDLRKGGLEAEIGPDKDKMQGPLGNLLYFGTSRSGPVLDIDSAPDAEEPNFHRFLEQVTEEL